MKKFITKPVIGIAFLLGSYAQPCKSQSVISGHVFNDLNNNGQYDAGEGVRLVTIWLLDKAAVSPYYLVYPVMTTVSAPDGSYSFSNVNNGDYQIRVNMISLSNTAIIDLGYTLTHAIADNNSYDADNYPNGVTDVSIPVAGLYQNVDFGFKQNPSVFFTTPQRRFAFDTGPNSFMNVLSQTYNLTPEQCSGATINPTITFTTDKQCTVAGQIYPQAGNATNPNGIDWPGPNKGGFYPGDVTLQMNFGASCYNPSNNDKATLNVNFSDLMSDVRFTIYDIDGSNPQLWNGNVDHVTVTGYNGGITVMPVISLPQQTPYNTVSGNTVSGWPNYPDNNSTNNYPDSYNSGNGDNGNANFYFPAAIDRFVVEYEEYAPLLIPSAKKIKTQVSPIRSEAQWAAPIDPTVRNISIGSIGYSLYCQILAAELISFDAKASGQQVNLQWKLADEQQIHEYDVERLAPDGSWKMLAAVKKGTGPVYNFTDRHPLKGINQYRIAIVHADATVRLSDTKKVVIQNITNDMEILANPATSLDVMLYGNAVSVVVYDISGKQLISYPVQGTNNSSGSIKVSFNQLTLNKGLYFVKALFTNAEEKTLKFIKN